MKIAFSCVSLICCYFVINVALFTLSCRPLISFSRHICCNDFALLLLMIIYHYSSTYRVFTSIVSKKLFCPCIFLTNTYSSRTNTQKYTRTLRYSRKNKRGDKERRRRGRSILSYFCSRKIALSCVSRICCYYCY